MMDAGPELQTERHLLLTRDVAVVVPALRALLQAEEYAVTDCHLVRLDVRCCRSIEIDSHVPGASQGHGEEANGDAMEDHRKTGELH